jgi:hypothetical protein
MENKSDNKDPNEIAVSLSTDDKAVPLSTNDKAVPLSTNDVAVPSSRSTSLSPSASASQPSSAKPSAANWATWCVNDDQDIIPDASELAECAKEQSVEVVTSTGSEIAAIFPEGAKLEAKLTPPDTNQGNDTASEPQPLSTRDKLKAARARARDRGNRKMRGCDAKITEVDSAEIARQTDVLEKAAAAEAEGARMSTYQQSQMMEQTRGLINTIMSKMPPDQRAAARQQMGNFGKSGRRIFLVPDPPFV